MMHASDASQRAGELAAQVFALVQACPAGRVTTYGWIARALGLPRGARMVGWIMNESGVGVPAQRVLNSKGELSGSAAFGAPGRMRALLEADGVVFIDRDTVDLKRYGWNPQTDLSPAALQSLLEAARQHPVMVSSGLVALLDHDPASPLTHASPPDETPATDIEQPKLF